MQPSLLTALQARLLDLLFHDDFGERGYYLTGGTALAEFYLKHRYSDDLDLFTRQPRDVAEDFQRFRAILVDRGLRVSLRSAGEQFVRAFVEDEESSEVMKIELARDVPARMAAPTRADAIVIDSFEDIAVNKVCTILDRQEPKDFVDLYFILAESRFTLEYLLERAKEKQANFESDEGRLRFAVNLHDVNKIDLAVRLVKPIMRDELESVLAPLAEGIIERYRPRQR